MIIARLSGGPLEHTGLIRGMSGSPVYIDGRLIGAIAYGWYFSQGAHRPASPPIAHMLDVAHARTSQPKPVRKVLDLDEETTRLLGGEGVSTLAPLGMPIAVAGFSPRGRQVLRDALDTPGIQLLGQPDRAGAVRPRGVYRAWSLAGRAANPWRLQRSRDWHPYLGRRRAFCRLWASDVFCWGPPICLPPGPISTKVIPIQTASFKLGTPTGAMGAVRQDRLPAIAGTTG